MAVGVDVAETTFAEELVVTHAFEPAVDLDLDSDFAGQVEHIADYYPLEKFVECCPNLTHVVSAFAFGLAVAVAAAAASAAAASAAVSAADRSSE